MSESTQYVTYYVAPQLKGGCPNNHGIPNSQPLSMARNTSLVENFLNERCPHGEIIETFVETPELRRNAKWPQLQKALELCKVKGANLLILELGTLASHDSFTQVLLSSQVPFHCVDQPFVNQTILEALSKHAEVQRKLHGKLIREGLKVTSAKSGNPNAAEVISKVNKPKIDTAIVFAFLLQPIIQDYRRKGYSQRQMVKVLNEEGFTAPEGGKWVLSQLQKVLDRVRLNEIATDLKETITEYNTQSLTALQIADALNTKTIPSLKQPGWDEAQVKKLQNRIQQIEDIVLMNRFVLHLLPLLHAYRSRHFSSTDILTEFQQEGVPIQQRALIA